MQAGRIAKLVKRWTHRPKGTGFYPRLDHKRHSTHDERLIVSPCEIIKIHVCDFGLVVRAAVCHTGD
jgi:hypothetical protein